MKIRMMLIAKGVKESVVDEALREIDPSDYRRALLKAIDKYKGDRERQIRLALQRGFGYYEIKEVVG